MIEGDRRWLERIPEKRLMPIHDWSRVEAGIFHDFHQAWTIEIRNALNGGVLPGEFYAMTDQVIGGPVPDVITLQKSEQSEMSASTPGGIAVADAPPRARFVSSAPTDPYVRRANRISVRHRLGRVVAVIEVVSPGNKTSRLALRTFVRKAEELLLNGIHLLIVDLFPPSRRDPHGIHKKIWDQIQPEPFELPADKPLMAAAYYAGEPKAAYVEPVAVGDALPSLPIFLDEDTYVPAPLEVTYQTTWDECPKVMREFVLRRP